MSVAIWSLRLRPVWSRPPAAPDISVTRRSIAVWTSSSPGLNSKLPSASSCFGRCQGRQQGGGLLYRKQPAALEAEHMSPAAIYVVTSQATVKREALSKGEELRRLLVPAKAALPERHRRSHYLLPEAQSQSYCGRASRRTVRAGHRSRLPVAQPTATFCAPRGGTRHSGRVPVAVPRPRQGEGRSRRIAKNFHDAPRGPEACRRAGQ